MTIGNIFETLFGRVGLILVKMWALVDPFALWVF